MVVVTSDGPQAAFEASTDSSRWMPTAPPFPDRNNEPADLSTGSEAGDPRGLATEHIIDSFGCWCNPYRDDLDPEVIIHRSPTA